jgi:hypothetical protein
MNKSGLRSDYYPFKHLSNSIDSASNSKMSKIDFNLVMSGFILFLVLICYMLSSFFIVDLKSQIEKEMVNLIMSNSSLLTHNESALENCHTLLTNLTLKKFKNNLNNYENHKLYSEYVNTAGVSVSILFCLTLTLLIKYFQRLYSNLLKRTCIVLSVLFILIEFVSLLLNLSIYLKSFHMYSFVENTVIFNKCFYVEGFSDIHETIVYKIFINSFVPTARSVYLCATILILIHFLNLTILIYKIKLIIVINSQKISIRSSFFPSIITENEIPLTETNSIINR